MLKFEHIGDAWFDDKKFTLLFHRDLIGWGSTKFIVFSLGGQKNILTIL
jgi:hypothetical protein